MRRPAVIVALGWLALGCGRHDEPASGAAPAGPRYYLIGKSGTVARDGQKLLPGFGVVVVEQHRSGAEWLARTSLGREIAMKDLRPAKPSRFAGVHLDGADKLDFGWVVRDAAPVYAAADSTAKVVARKPRYARVTLSSLDGPQGFYRIADGWMSEADLRVPHRSARPGNIGDDDPWLDVELTSQTLVAYVGDRPVFATLVATGVGPEGTPFATPKGVHRVRGKLVAATMDNLEHTGVAPYSYEEVPFTQYIGRVALHGAFWHDQFGIPRSHGCINLSPTDAEWLFGFTKPALAEGEAQVAASERKPGTVVRVR